MARSWDAAAYHRVSVAMDRMAQEVLDRLPLGHVRLNITGLRG
ncbi:hypothetical protein O7635_11605 [Asanoa sp. WMMD1127]|nr:hypothetical protein [Asanoa sp. WMMD1127]MDG4822495.1 hypothetical protein [Asanoa sp. WMMD1127]